MSGCNLVGAKVTSDAMSEGNKLTMSLGKTEGSIVGSTDCSSDGKRVSTRLGKTLAISLGRMLAM